MADFNPFETGALFKKHQARWLLEQDFAEPTLDVFENGTHLPKFSDKELGSDYDFRKSMSVPLDLCQDAIRIRVDNIWRAAPKREIDEKSKYAETLDQLLHDADNDGTPLDAIMKRVLRNYYTTGCDVVTQTTAVPVGVELQTERDRIDAGIRSYFLLFSPLQRYNWACNGSGNFIWARYCLGANVPGDEYYGAENATTFLTLTPNEWRQHTARKSSDDDPVVRVTTVVGPHNFGRPPIIKAYFSESQRFGEGGVPISLISRAAHVARVALNLKSQADAELIAAVPRWMFTGTDAAPDSYGPGTLWATKDPDSKLLVVQGNVSHIVEKRAWLVLYLLEILRLLKFRGGMGEIEGNAASGVKLALEMTDLQNELRSTAGFMEETELEMVRQAVILSTGDDISAEDAGEKLGYQVTYNRVFALEPVADMLANIKTFVNECGFVPDDVPEMTREMLRQLRNLLVRDSSPVAEIIDEQIDAASFQGTSDEGGTPERTLTGEAEGE